MDQYGSRHLLDLELLVLVDFGIFVQGSVDLRARDLVLGTFDLRLEGLDF